MNLRGQYEMNNAEQNQNKKIFEQKDPLWIQLHELEEAIKNKKYDLNKISEDLIKLANTFLNKYTNKEDLKEIIIAFENLSDMLLYYYGDDARELYEEHEIGEILASFDSLIFDYEYGDEIKKLKDKIKTFLKL